jgi:hypothetical protein
MPGPSAGALAEELPLEESLMRVSIGAGEVEICLPIVVVGAAIEL